MVARERNGAPPALPPTHRKTKPRDWASKGLLTFAAGSRARSVAPPPKGAYALAYRFVEAATGRETAMAVIGRVTVQ